MLPDEIIHSKLEYMELLFDHPEGYLEFLKETQKELREALEDRKKETGKELDEIEEEIQQKYKSNTLARIIDEYNWTLANPFIEE